MFPRSIEKEVNETAGPVQKSREQHDYYQKIQSLKERYEKFREQVNKIQGIELTKEEQLKRVDTLSKQLVMKRELLLRYRHNCPIDSTKM